MIFGALSAASIFGILYLRSGTEKSFAALLPAEKIVLFAEFPNGIPAEWKTHLGEMSKALPTEKKFAFALLTDDKTSPKNAPAEKLTR